MHLSGGVAGLVFALMLGPRKGRYDRGTAPPPGNGTNILLGTFILWCELFFGSGLFIAILRLLSKMYLHKSAPVFFKTSWQLC